MKNIAYHIGTVLWMCLVLPFILAFAGCVSETPQQQTATAIYAAGYVVARDALNSGSGILAQLQDVASKLPQLNSGKLTPSDMGVLSAELANVQSQIPLLKGIAPADSTALEDAKAFLAGVIVSNASLNGGKAPTVDQLLATTLLTDFSSGLTDGIAYWQGAHSVAKPPPATP